MPMTPSPRYETARRIVESLCMQLGGHVGLLSEPDVIELMLNPDGHLWADRLGSGMTPVGRMSSRAAEAFIATVASTLRTTVTRESPILECELPVTAPFDGSRFEGLIPPVVRSPVFTIRRKASAVIALNAYERQGIITASQRAVIEAAVRDRLNVLIVGSTGSGKTTLVNAVLAHLAAVAPDHRLVVIEDTVELQCSTPNAVSLRATDTVSMQRLLKATMRLRPDRIVVGEVRDGSALALLKAWNTGHPGGVCTVHASNAHAGLHRIEQLIAEVSQTPMRALIAEAVNLIVVITKTDTAPGRRVSEIVRVIGTNDGLYQLEPVGENG